MQKLLGRNEAAPAAILPAESAKIPEDIVPEAEAQQAEASRDIPAELPAACRPASRLHQPAWKARFEKTCAMLVEKSHDLVWIGDSCVQQFERAGRNPWMNFAPVWARYYAPRGAINLGFAGDDTSNLIWRLQNGHLHFPQARAVAIMIGVNNIVRPNFHPDDTAQAIQLITAMIADHAAGARVLVLSLFPNGRDDEKNAQQLEVNTRVQARLADMPRVDFVDLTGIFVKNGEIDLTKFRDPQQTPPQPALHPSAAAQAEIAALLEPTMAEIFGPLS